MGLSISKKIIGKLGGEIGFMSEWGKGSTFMFCIKLDNKLPASYVDSIMINEIGEPELSDEEPIMNDDEDSDSINNKSVDV